MNAGDIVLMTSLVCISCFRVVSTWSDHRESRSAVGFLIDVFQGNFFTFLSVFVVTCRIVLGFDK